MGADGELGPDDYKGPQWAIASPRLRDQERTRRGRPLHPIRLRKGFDLCPHQLALIGQKRPPDDRSVWKVAGKLPDRDQDLLI